MRLLLLSVLILPIVLGGALPGQEKCAWGPPYWCSRVSHARECGATQHCLQTVWKNQNIKPTSTATCTYCEVIVNGMKDAFNSKTAQADAADVLSRVCVLIPESDARDMCKELVTENVVVLIKMFENEINTDTICATLGLCSGLEDTWSPYGVMASNTSDCGDCTKFITDLQQSITSQESINQLEQLLNQALCSQLGSLSTECNDLVKQFLPAVLQAMADEIDPDIVCRMLGFCTTDGKLSNVYKIKNVFAGRKSKGTLRYRSSEECEICKDFFIQIESLLNATTTQDRVKYELKNVVCTVFGSMEDECKELVDEYVPWMFDLLLNELDPTTVCESAGLCPVPDAHQVAYAMHVQPAAMVGPGFVQDTYKCKICEIIVQYVDKFLEENKTITTLDNFVDNICQKLVTTELAKECEAFVMEYGQLVLDLLAEELDPKLICGKIDMCTKSMGIVRNLKGDDGVCQVCMLIVNEIDAALVNMSTADIIKDLDAMCGYLPSSMSKACIHYMDDYAALVIDMIKSEKPRELCSLAQMCNGSVGSLLTKIISEKQRIVQNLKGDDGMCQVCMLIVNEIDAALVNMSTADIIKDLDEMCSYLPSSMSKACIHYMDDYAALVIDTIKSEKPRELCSLAQMCNGSVGSHLTKIISEKQPIKSDEACEVCDTVIIGLKIFMKDNSTKAEIKTAVETLCEDLPDIGDQCKQFIKNYGDRIIDQILEKLQPHAICIELRLCTSVDKMAAVSVVMSPYDTLPLLQPTQDKIDSQSTGNAIECNMCTVFMNYLDNQLQENKTKESIKAVLKEMCSTLPSEMLTKCTEFVDTYTDAIVNYFVLGLKPQQICQVLTLCSTRSLPQPVHITLLKDNNGALFPAADKPYSDVECKLCTIVIKKVYTILKENASEEDVKEALDKVCTYLPTKYTSKCLEYVDDYTAELIKLILAGTDPSEVCSSIGLCTTDTSSPWATLVKILPEKTKGADKLTSETECELCTVVVTQIDKYFKETTSEEYVKEELDKACDILPGTTADECKTFVNQYTAVVIQLIIQGLVPKEVCSSLRLCPSATSSPWATLVKILPEETKGADKLKSDAECDLCKYLIAKVYSIMQENTSEEYVKKELDKACNILPATMVDECTTIVNQYTAEIINLIITGTAPTEICSSIGMCPSDNLVKKIPEKIKGLDLCPVCKFIVVQLQQILKQNRTAHKVEQFLKNVCDVLPDTVTSQCHDNVDKYVPEVLAHISNSLKPEQICQTVGLCNVTRTDTKDDATLYYKPHKMVGQDKCTYGPAYWCVNTRNAAECNAVDHCQKYVWN